jgi:hypothetical protein
MPTPHQLCLTQPYHMLRDPFFKQRVLRKSGVLVHEPPPPVQLRDESEL